MERIESGISQLLTPGKGILVLDEYAESLLTASGVPSFALDEAIAALATSGALAGTVSGVLLTHASYVAVAPMLGERSGVTPTPLVGVRQSTRGAPPGTKPDFVEFRAHLKPTDVPRGGTHIDAARLAEHVLAAQQLGVLPVVSVAMPDIGSHKLSVTQAATSNALSDLFAALRSAGADLGRFVLRLNFVDAGLLREPMVDVDEAAEATFHVLARLVPDEVPGVAMLSGGMSLTRSCALLSRVSGLAHEHGAPWEITFAYSRALVEPALRHWRPGEADGSLEQSFANTTEVAAAAMTPALKA